MPSRNRDQFDYNNRNLDFIGFGVVMVVILLSLVLLLTFAAAVSGVARL